MNFLIDLSFCFSILLHKIFPWLNILIELTIFDFPIKRSPILIHLNNIAQTTTLKGFFSNLPIKFKAFLIKLQFFRSCFEKWFSYLMQLVFKFIFLGINNRLTIWKFFSFSLFPKAASKSNLTLKTFFTAKQREIQIFYLHIIFQLTNSKHFFILICYLEYFVLFSWWCFLISWSIKLNYALDLFNFYKKWILASFLI
jgi:hypothetical protein